MKKYLTMAAMMVSCIVAQAQKANWKEMHDFHAIMSKTFHPAEEGNLQPIKDSAGVLLAKAKAWQASALPTGYSAKTTAPILKELVQKCAAVSAAVAAKKSDKEITRLTTQAHDTFHEIMEKCSKEEGHH